MMRGVNNKLLKAPEKVEPWSGTLNAFEYGNVCVQKRNLTGRVIGSEDCLFLNIFTPSKLMAFVLKNN